MLTQPQSPFRSLLWGTFALALGLIAWNTLLSTFIPDFLESLTVLLLTVPFFFGLRWLGSKEDAGVIRVRSAAQSKRIRLGLLAPDQRRVFRLHGCRK